MARTRRCERGSALIIAVLVTAILSLLGISFLMMAETENRIAQNEMLASQALYVAESGGRLVKRWFDYPGTALHFPSVAVVDRQQRHILDEADPSNPALVVAANGSSRPWYKQGIDLDGNGVDDLFRAPYRVGMRDSFLGTETNPDMRIDDGTSAAATFLADVSDTLLADYPDAGNGIRARISRIDVYAPPYILIGSAWRRYGTASVKVVARVYRDGGSSPAVLAEREVRMVLSEIPYEGPIGPLHSCSDLTFTGTLTAHWGPVTADGRVKISYDGGGAPETPRSIPRDVPAIAQVDPLWNTWDPFNFAQLRDWLQNNNAVLEDPWFQLIAGGPIEGAPSGLVQPFNPLSGPPTSGVDRSNVVQNLPAFECPRFDYDVWKAVATSGGREVRYFQYVAATDPPQFRENGTGSPDSMRNFTNGRSGVYFFDTADGQAPRDGDADGSYDNLTPALVVTGGSWSFDGMLYVNADRFKLDGVTGAATSFRAPGEPFHDANQNDYYEGSPLAERELWIELDIPTTLGAAIRARPMTGGSVRNARGPVMPGQAALRGILFTNGAFDATGDGTVYGTVVARRVSQGVADGTATTPDLYWDESILRDWPPPGTVLPRMVVTRWITER